MNTTAVTAAGNTYQVVVYVDPFPGRKGGEVLKETCGKCGGDKVIGWGNITLKVNGVDGRVCFQCMGKGYTTRLVSSARSTARRQAKAQTAANAKSADWVDTTVEDAHTEALAEQARRDALVQGFAGEVGARLRGLQVRVDVNAKFEADAFNGYGVDYKSLLIFTDLVTGHVFKAVTDARDLGRGSLVNLTGTVKAHASYNGQDQTVLQRIIIK